MYYACIATHIFGSHKGLQLGGYHTYMQVYICLFHLDKHWHYIVRENVAFIHNWMILSWLSRSASLFCSLQLYYTWTMCHQRCNALFRHCAMHYKGAYTIIYIYICVYYIHICLSLNNLTTVISLDRIPSPIVGRNQPITRENSAPYAVRDWMKHQRCIV